MKGLRHHRPACVFVVCLFGDRVSGAQTGLKSPYSKDDLKFVGLRSLPSKYQDSRPVPPCLTQWCWESIPGQLSYILSLTAVTFNWGTVLSLLVEGP